MILNETTMTWERTKAQELDQVLEVEVWFVTPRNLPH